MVVVVDDDQVVKLERRRQLGYPPATTLIGLEASSPDARTTGGAAAYLANAVRASLKSGEEVIGPSPLRRARDRRGSRRRLWPPPAHTNPPETGWRRLPVGRRQDLDQGEPVVRQPLRQFSGGISPVNSLAFSLQ